MPLPKEFTERIGVVDITLSKFEDQNELWAKRWDQTRRIKVVFADGVTTYLEPADFSSLSAAHQTLVRIAPSGP